MYSCLQQAAGSVRRDRPDTLLLFAVLEISLLQYISKSSSSNPIKWSFNNQDAVWSKALIHQLSHRTLSVDVLKPGCNQVVALPGLDHDLLTTMASSYLYS